MIILTRMIIIFYWSSNFSFNLRSNLWQRPKFWVLWQHNDKRHRLRVFPDLRPKSFSYHLIRIPRPLPIPKRIDSLFWYIWKSLCRSPLFRFREPKFYWKCNGSRFGFRFGFGQFFRILDELRRRAHGHIRIFFHLRLRTIRQRLIQRLQASNKLKILRNFKKFFWNIWKFILMKQNFVPFA